MGDYLDILSPNSNGIGGTIGRLYNSIRSVNDSVELTANSDTPVVSVVIVTYNEQERIRDCIESVFDACSHVEEYEVILVDSNSTDETVPIATDYPVTVLRIPNDELTTPGAGRYIGTNAARGEYVLFVDGDMIIHRNWFEEALDLLRNSPIIAGVDGELNESSAHHSPRPVDAIRGVALYRKDALESVGGFDPFLQSLEDIHLGLELTTAGYELYRLPTVAANHPERTTFVEPIRRWRRGYMFGTGQALRKSTSNPKLFIRHLYRLRHRLILLAWLIVGLFSAFAFPMFILWVVLSAVGVTALISKLGAIEAIGILFSKSIGIVGLFRGIFLDSQPPESFPLQQIEHVQSGPADDAVGQKEPRDYTDGRKS